MGIRAFRTDDAAAVSELAASCLKGETDFVLNPLWETEAELTAEFEEDLLEGMVVIRGQARRRDRSNWEGKLYQPAHTPRETVDITAVPYYAWANREPGEMLVWIPEG